MSSTRPFVPTEIRPGVIASIRPCQSSLVGVLRAAGGHRLVAVRPIAAHTTLCRIDGIRTHHPTRFSLQIDEHQHIDLDHSLSSEEIFEHHFWRFLNHSCEPNTVIRNQTVIATHDIASGADVTFDYNTTEYEIAEPFACHCQSEHCLKFIRGFRHLTEAQREHLRHALMPYLARQLDRRVEQV